MSEQLASTKVYYYLDDSTPYMSEIPVSPELLTLGEFKKVFNRRKGYSYFCKEWDTYLKREVKVEITRDRQQLHKSANGLFELFLLSQQNMGAPGNADTLPRAGKSTGTSGGKTASNMATIAAEQRPKPGPIHACSALALSSVASSELDIGGGQRVSMVTGTESDVQTLISRRAGERLAELYNSTSEDPYNRTSISSSGIFHRAPLPSAESTTESAGLDRTLLALSTAKQRRQHRKQRCRKPYVPSTISSESSYSLPRIEEVKLRLGPDTPLGISVASQDGSIFIYNMQAGSAAEKCGQLEVGDQIVQIDDTRFEDLNEKQALELLKKLSNTKRVITMYVAKRGRANGGESSEEQKSDALSLLCETTQQLDISQWVESTKQCPEPFRPFIDISPQKASTAPAQKPKQSFAETIPHPLAEEKVKQQPTVVAMDETSDEERAAYKDRRNGVGARLVPAIQQQVRIQQQKENEERRKQMMTFNMENQIPGTSHPFIFGATEQPVPSAGPTSAATAAIIPPRDKQPLHAAMEPTTILRRMVEPNSGLTIRDRKWLKIPVPMSFIGEEMVDWLVGNVQGFRDRKGAKAFASKLLINGLIRHVVNIHSFSEKCYYIFDDAIIADRVGLDDEQKLMSVHGSSRRGMANQQPAVEIRAEAVVASKNVLVANNTGPSSQPESTEITYMSSNQSSPFFGVAAGPANAGAAPPPLLVVANNPRYVQGPSILNRETQEAGLTAAKNANKNNAQTMLANKLNNNHTAAIPLRTLNPPKFGLQLPVWPISPIPFRAQTQRAVAAEAGQMPAHEAEEGCMSPETNDYASMIQGEINCGAQFDVQFDGLLAQNGNNNHAISIPSVVPQRQHNK